MNKDYSSTPEKRTLEHLKTCLMQEHIKDTLDFNRLVRYINGIEEWAKEVGKKEGEREWIPTQFHLELKLSTDNHSPKKNVSLNMRD